MYKNFGMAALAALLSFAQLANADSLEAPKAAVLPQVSFTYPEAKAEELIAPSPQTAINYTLASPDRAVKAYRVQIAPLTNVEDMAARVPFWGPVDVVVIGLAGIAAIFMRLLLVRQRKPRFAGGISVETIA